MASKRQRLRKELWSEDEDVWTGEEVGWFKIPRTFPLCLALLKKDIRGPEDPTAVYLELLSHHYGEGFIELKQESDHAFACGFSVGRLRSWHERMAKLEELGFIKTKSAGASKYKYVLLMHPTTVIQNLRDQGKIEDRWWNMYIARKAETRELTYEQRDQQKKQAANTRKRSGKTIRIGKSLSKKSP
ncbi:hypothetical protein FTW19_04530 [Terriglobus albidus]|uniref:Uncharacterized protein n=1 Tax=Terriglobus albidus TaxID=1592106 RepID=A0A5B9E516_9BACT|nr:hypothetical protein [Terriglobus albidus]QEE27342.1 hypothetical protein FTW19_04530 [Terriglobus albidus]